MPINNKSFPDYIRFPLVLLGIVLSLLLLYFGKILFVPLLFGFLLAIFIYPLCNWLEKRHFPKSLAALLSVMIFILFIFGIIFLLAEQFSQFFKDLPAFSKKLNEVFQNFQKLLSNRFHITFQLNYFIKSAKDIMASVSGAFAGFFELVIMIVLFIFFTFYILSFRSMLIKFALAFSKQENEKKFFTTIIELRAMINNYIKGLMIEMSIVFTLIFLAILILGIKYALLIAAFTALLNIIPYIGMYTAIVINVMIVLSTGTPVEAVEALITFVIVHLIDSNFILPKIVGGQVKMNVFITLIVVIIGELLWGIPGMFLFIPLTAIFKIVSEKISFLKPWAILIGVQNKSTHKNKN